MVVLIVNVGHKASLIRTKYIILHVSTTILKKKLQ